MASSSSSSLRRTWRYNVFTSFHGPDVRETLLSHLRKQFENNAITMFNDENIKRGEIIAPALIKAIEESRISIVLLSKQYASSRWCLDELLEIIKCREEIGQEVRTVFYGVEPSDVRNQDGEFGDAFNKTCAKNPEKREKWRKGLTEVGNIAGEVFKNWKNEAEMIEKIASDISERLLDTTPKDFDDKVGLKAHMREMESRLQFDNNDVVKIVAISGPAGIGKTTIARAIYSRHSKNFHHDCFLDLRKLGDDEYDEYALREELLSQLLNRNGIKKCHSGLIPDRLHDQKVFIILDDVQSLNQLDVLAIKRWYGPGSRIIVTTENEEILEQRGINDIYHVSFPSQGEALKIFCLSAFEKTSPPDGFLNLSNEVVRICSNLPLGLKVVGSLLRGKNLDGWELELPRLKDSLDRSIESVLQVGYKSLREEDQLIFLCIAAFFNGEDIDYVTSKLDEPIWNARLGLKNLVNRNLIQYVGFGQTTTPSTPFGQTTIPSTPFGQTNTSSTPFGQTTTSSMPFGQTTIPSMFGSTSSNSTSVFGSSPGFATTTSQPFGSSIFGSTPAQGSTPAFSMGGSFNNSQSASLFSSNPASGQTNSPFGQTSSPFGQTSSAFGQNTNPAFGQPNNFSTPSTGFGNLFSSSSSLTTSSSPFGQTTPAGLTPSQSVQPAQPPANTTAVIGGSFDQGNFRFGPGVMQPIHVTNPFGTLPALPQISIAQGGNPPSIQYGISSMPVVDKPAPVRVSPLLTSRHLLQRRVRLPTRKHRPGDDGPKVPFFSEEEENSSTPKVDAFFIPRENPRALFIRPIEREKSAHPKDGPTPLQENSKKLNGVTNGAKHEKIINNSETHEAHAVKISQKLNGTNGTQRSEENGSNSSPSGPNIESLLPKLQHFEYFTEPGSKN